MKLTTLIVAMVATQATLTFAKDGRSPYGKVSPHCMYCALKYDTCTKLCKSGQGPCAYECQVKTCMEYDHCKKCSKELPVCKYANSEG